MIDFSYTRVWDRELEDWEEGALDEISESLAWRKSRGASQEELDAIVDAALARARHYREVPVPRCATCRHWRRDTEREDVALTGTCQESTRAYSQQTEHPAMLAITSEAFNIDGLATSPDFGCVLHEEKS